VTKLIIKGTIKNNSIENSYNKESIIITFSNLIDVYVKKYIVSYNKNK
jgi:predicted nucleic-acid-binding Zn-ribbon protein